MEEDKDAVKENSKCPFCGNNNKELNEFGVCEECWNMVLRAQNIIYGGSGINPYKETE